MVCVAALDKRFSKEHFGQNTTNGPNVNFFIVINRAQQNFRRSIPSGGHIICQLLIFFFWGQHCASQPKVANDKLAIAVDQNISRFQVPMNDLPFVQIVQAQKNLIQETLYVLDWQLLVALDDGAEVWFVQFIFYVNLVQIVNRAWQSNWFKLQNIFMVAHPHDA